MVIATTQRVGAPPLRPTRAEIDLDAIRHNVRLLRAKAAPAELMVVVKADGYGHGAIEVARAALDVGAPWLAVALVEEGEELRAAGLTAPILVLTEPPATAVARLVAADLTPTLYSTDFAEALRLEASARGRPLPVHLKVDTGMARVGVARQEWDAFLQRLRAWPELEVVAAWTHLANADEPGHPTVAEQVRAFDSFLQLARTQGVHPQLTHLANSSAALVAPEVGGDLVRAGIAVYGLPAGPATADAADLRPALRLVTQVALVKHIDAGTPVSYGHTWTAPAAGWLATIPIGYADGLPRALSNRGAVLINGRARPIVGSVTMDQTLVWCGEDRVSPGDEVVLLGDQRGASVSALDWAEAIGTITYEIVTGISPRVPRRYVGDPGAADVGPY